MICKHRRLAEVGFDIFISDSGNVISERQFQCDDCGELFFRDDDASENTIKYGNMCNNERVSGICSKCGKVWYAIEADHWSYHETLGVFCNEHEDLMSEWNRLWEKSIEEYNKIKAKPEGESK